jgi:ATP-binding cassette subfamily B multidrug efflux pump
MKSLRSLNKYFIKYKWRFTLGVIFVFISNYFGVQMPLYVKDSIDQLLSGTYIKGINDVIWLSLKLGGIYMLLSACSGLFLFFMRQTIIVMSRFIEYDIKNEIYDHYQKLSYSFYKKNATGDLMNRITEDVSQVRMYLGPGIMYTINLIALFLLVIFQMIAINPTLTLFVLLPLPLMSFLIYKVSTKMNLLSKNVQSEQSMLSTIVQESFSGIRIIKAFNREKEFHAKFNQTAENYFKKSMSLVLVNALFMPTIVFLIGLSTLLSIYLGGIMSYDSEISLGGIVAFIFFVNKLTWPFASIGWVTSINQRAAASQTRINEFLQIQPEIISNNEPFEFNGAISFRNVSMTYPNTGINALSNVSFHIDNGKTLAILGNTGSGKSTIINLLLRQFDPTEGEILIDNKPLKQINLNAFRNVTGVVPQEVFLFSDSIENNIKFGSLEDQISSNRLEEVTKMSHVYHNIIEFKDGFQTILGERGVNLSGGQKQRLSISRALIRHPKLLILDDCLSAVDTETEEIILGNLKKFPNNPTTLIVSHRISSIRNADHIIVISDGKVVEEGNHELLLKNNGFYASIYFNQLNEDIK